MRRKIFASYGLRGDPLGYRLDRLIPTGLGGTNSRRNLWVVSFGDAYLKRTVGQELGNAVCDGRIALAKARAEIVDDYRSALAGTGTYFHLRRGYVSIPRYIDYCSSGCEYSELLWEGWHTPTATGTGYATPVTSGEVTGRYPVTITLSRPATCPNGVSIYTRYVQTYTGELPSRFSERTTTIRWRCDGSFD